MKRCIICIMVMAMAFITGCAGKNKLTDEQAQKFFYQPFIMLAYGQVYQINSFKDLHPVLKDVPPAFSIRMTEAQAVNTNYHKHLAATFRQMGYQLTKETLLDASPQPTPAPIPVEKQQKKSGKKVQTPSPVPQPRQMLLQQDYELMGYQGNMGQQQYNGGYNGGYNNGNNGPGTWERVGTAMLPAVMMGGMYMLSR